MPIDVQCACGKRARVPDTMAGKRGRCPVCKAPITVPSPVEPSDGDDFAFLGQASPPKVPDAGGVQNAPRTKSLESESPLAKIGPGLASIGVVSSVLSATAAAGVTKYVGEMALVPGVAGLISGVVASFAFNAQRKPFVTAFAVQFGQLAWVTAAFMLIGNVNWIAADVAIMAIGLALLVAFPGLWPVVILTVYQSAGLCLNGRAMFQADIGSPEHKALVVHVALRVSAILAMAMGLNALEKAAPRRRTSWPSLALLAVAGGVGCAISVAAIVFNPALQPARKTVAKAKVPKPNAAPPATNRPTPPKPKQPKATETSKPTPPRPVQPPPQPAIAYVSGAGRTINLIDHVNLLRDALQPAKWELRGGELACTQMHFVPRISFPYRPCEEFDITVEFTQPKPRNGVGIIIPNRKTRGSFAWVVGAGGGKRCFVSVGERESEVAKEADGFVRPGVRHRLVVRVRGDHIESTIDGKEIAEYHTDYQDLQASNWHKLPDPTRLGVSADDVTTFHVIELVEVKGQGELGDK